ncbi:FAD-binding protein [Dehalococcoidia bacterium]|nr:FAD-binding protein [Dehalococcoidia bacterium]
MSYCNDNDAWIPRQQQIGLTGRAISPPLYIAIRVRGSYNHMVGVRKAGIIAVVNNSPQHAIFKAVDIGVVGDYFSVIPALTRAFRRALR